MKITLHYLSTFCGRVRRNEITRLEASLIFCLMVGLALLAIHVLEAKLKID